MLLSIAMMVKNESKNLDECLRSLQPIRNSIESELIIVDTGSTDDTVEIAKRYTDKVYFHKWNDNFSEMRNITIDYSKGKWLLIIDGDEVIEDPEGMIEFFTQNQYKNFKSASIKVTSFIDAAKSEKSSLLSARLFKNEEDLRYEGAVHNQIMAKAPMAKLKGEILHYGYIADDKELMERKFERTSRILKSELEKDPENIYYRHQLAVTYAMHKDHKESLEESMKVYNILNTTNKDKAQYIYVYNQLVKGLAKFGRYSEAEKFGEEALALDDKNIDVLLWLGKIQFSNGNYEKARRNYEKYLSLFREDKSLKVDNLALVNYTVDKYEVAYIDLFEIYYQGAEYDKCWNMLDEIESEEFYDLNLKKVVDCFISLNNFEGLKGFYLNKNIGSKESIYETFICALENRLKSLDEKARIEVYSKFIDGSANYDCLNRIRLNFYREENETVFEEIDIILSKFNLNEAVDFWGDLFYILMAKKQSLKEYFIKLSDKSISIYLDFIKEYHKDFLEVAKCYVDELNENLDFGKAKVKKALLRLIITDISMEDKEYLEFFKLYIESGVSYIKQLYREDILDNECIFDLKNDEEIFLNYMYKANKTKDYDMKEHINYLKIAFRKIPMFKKGIELLLKEIEDENNEPTEMDILSNSIKANIQSLISGGLFEQAEELIRQYEKMIIGDIDITLLKSEIMLKKSEILN